MPVGRPKLDRRLQLCQEVDMNCEDCMRDSAASLTSIAGDLSQAQARSLFLSMFPEPNCRVQATQFVQLIQVDSEPAPRRRPASVTVLQPAIFAVA